MTKKILLPILASSIGLLFTGCPKDKSKSDKEVIQLSVGSWRTDDANQMAQIFEEFNKEYPGIKVSFEPTTPDQYNATLGVQLEGGIAPDLFYLRSYATSRMQYESGYIDSLEDIPGLMDSFSEASREPWATDDKVPYGVPMNAVSHGIYYNIDIFEKLRLSIPETWEELISSAQKIQQTGYIPFANASKDEWTIAEIVFMNIAPNFIGGQEGREAYLNGERPFNDPKAVSVFEAVRDIVLYLPPGQSGLTYYDSQQLFLQGIAAMWFGGSWDISIFEAENPSFEWSIFAVPPPSGATEEYICFHPDSAMGLNAASLHKKEAKIFLQWLTEERFANLLGNYLPGFFPIANQVVSLENHYAATFMKLNEEREKDVRWAWPTLLEFNPDGYTLMQEGAVGVINGTLIPQQAADNLEKGLAPSLREWRANR